jgi:hypothetical protein
MEKPLLFTSFNSSILRSVEIYLATCMGIQQPFLCSLVHDHGSRLQASAGQGLGKPRNLPTTLNSISKPQMASWYSPIWQGYRKGPKLGQCNCKSKDRPGSFG